MATKEPTRRVNLSLPEADMERLRRLSPSKNRHWAGPVFRPAVQLILAIGDIRLAKRFIALGPAKIRTAIALSIAEHDNARISEGE